MLEPRYDTYFGDRVQFLGGTEDFDLWYNAEYQNLQVVGANGHSMWAAYDIENGAIAGTGIDDTNDAADPALRERVADKKGEIETYLQCFAPWVLGGGLTDV
jgi:hypothetical protein